MALLGAKRVRRNRNRRSPVLCYHVEEGSWGKSRFDPRVYWQEVTEDAMAYAVGGRLAGFPARSGHLVGIEMEYDSESESDSDSSPTVPTATESERAKSRTVGARTAKLPAESYQKLLRIVRDSKAGTSDVE